METQSSKSQNMREFRRLRAVELFGSGMKQVDIVRVPGVTKGAVSQWLSIYRHNGLDALRYRKIAKKLCRLSDEQKDELRELLSQGPEHFGYAGDVWTLPRIAELVLRKFGISYCPTSMSAILKKLAGHAGSQLCAQLNAMRKPEKNGFRKSGLK